MGFAHQCSQSNISIEVPVEKARTRDMVMGDSVGSSPGWIPKTKAEQDAVVEQLGRILSSPLFRHSKRYPAFLRYVVERTLDSRHEALKERTLGVEVFHRPADYDTNSDPIVRFTAGEIRKRIAQYYFQPGHEREIRIEIPSGSYVPEFRLPEFYPSHSLIPPEQEQKHSDTVLAGSSANSDSYHWPLRHVSLPAAFVLLFCATIGAVWTLWPDYSSLNRFWKPVVTFPGEALVCVSTEEDLPAIKANETSRVNQGSQKDIPLYDVDRWMNRLVLADGMTLSKIAAVLYSKQKDYRVESAKTTSLEDLRYGPIVLIGAFDNEWTMRFTKDLRFSFAEDIGRGYSRIVDHSHPERKDWAINSSAPYTTVTRDYAIIARYKNRSTGTIVVIAGGLGEYGTLAAGEILSNIEYFRDATRRAPRNWQNMNMEAVVSTEVINGKSGPPQVVDIYFW